MSNAGLSRKEYGSINNNLNVYKYWKYVALNIWSWHTLKFIPNH